MEFLEAPVTWPLVHLLLYLFWVPYFFLFSFLFSTSSHFNMILVGAAVSDLKPQSTEEYVGLANLLALLVGVNFLMMSLLRLGFLINFLSRPVLRFVLLYKRKKERMKREDVRKYKQERKRNQRIQEKNGRND